MSISLMSTLSRLSPGEHVYVRAEDSNGAARIVRRATATTRYTAQLSGRRFSARRGVIVYSDQSLEQIVRIERLT